MQTKEKRGENDHNTNSLVYTSLSDSEINIQGIPVKNLNTNYKKKPLWQQKDKQ